MCSIFVRYLFALVIILNALKRGTYLTDITFIEDGNRSCSDRVFACPGTDCSILTTYIRAWDIIPVRYLAAQGNTLAPKRWYLP